MSTKTTARIKTTDGKRFVVEHEQYRATHGRRSTARLYEYHGGHRSKLQDLDSSLSNLTTEVVDALDALGFYTDGDVESIDTHDLVNDGDLEVPA